MRLYLRPSANTTPSFDPPSHLFTGTWHNIIELGSGVGYVGLHFARQLTQYAQSQAGAGKQRRRVVLTDLDNVCPLLQRNAQRAGFAAPSAAGEKEVEVLVRALPWGSSHHAEAVLAELYPSSSSTNGPLTLLCSDLVYFPALLAPLLRSLISLTHTQRGGEAVRIVIGYKIRSLTKEEPFWRAFGSWFAWDVVRCRRDDKEEWDRFGKCKWHLEGDAENKKEEEEEEAKDDYFILSAVRRSDSVGATAPTDDAKLMSGWRIRPRSTLDLEAAEAEQQEAETEWEQGLGGEGFELMLMRELQSI